MFLLLLAAGAPAQQGAAPPPKHPRLALVIGNAAYKDAPLRNPVNDAADVAKALEASGFKVIRRENAGLREMHLALREFGDSLGRQSTGLFYFAGHGLQVRGRNYLLPVDSDVAREDEVAFSAIELGAVMEKLDSARNPVNIVILDACRNNPFGSRIQPSVKGLAQVDAPPGTLIAFSTAPGSTSADGAGRNGLYTQHLVREIDRPGLAIEEVFKATRAAVRADSRNAQIPWESTSLESDFRFRAAPPAPKPKPVVAAAQPAAKAGGAQRSVPTSVAAPPNFAVGDRWTYRIVNRLDNSERTWVHRVKDIRAGEVHYQNGNVSDLLGNNTRINRSGGRVEIYKPSVQSIVFPMLAGSSFALKGVQEASDRTYDMDIELRIVGEEEVETALGRMRGMRVQRISRWKQRNSANAGVSDWTFWYSAATKRYFLSEQTNTTATGKVIFSERQELLAHELK